MNKDDLVKSIASSKGYLYVDDGDESEATIYIKEQWERYAVSEFARLARRYNLDFTKVSCKAIQIVHNFTIVHLSVTIDGVFSGSLYGASKVRVGDHPCPFVGISVAVRNLMRTISGKTDLYTA